MLGIVRGVYGKGVGVYGKGLEVYVLRTGEMTMIVILVKG